MNNTLVVLNYNDFNNTSKFLMNAKKINSIEHIIVVDNNSSDNSYQQLKKYECEKIKVIKSDKNGGYAYGNNFGMRYAQKNYNAEYFIISNPDVIFTESLIKECTDFLDINKEAALCTGIMKNIEGKKLDNRAWKLPTFLDDLILSSLLLNKIFGHKLLAYNNCGDSGKYMYVDVVPGSFFIVRADVMKEIGWFDERTFLYCEERILSFRLKQKGYKEVLLSDNSYIHMHSQTISKNIKGRVTKYKILQKSRRLYQKEYLKKNNICLMVFDIITLAGIFENYLYGIYEKYREHK